MGIRQIRKSKRDANFDPDTPRCGTCKSKTMRNDIKITGPVPWCDWHGFQLPNGGMGLCDEWRGKDGTTLAVDGGAQCP